MLTLVIGGSASGKSEYAERLIEKFPGERIYIATMQPYDDESFARIKKHRNARAGRNFTTAECPVGLDKISIPKGSNVLLEDIDNLTANEYFMPDGDPRSIIPGIDHILESCGFLTVVAGEVFSGGSAYLGETLDYLRTLADIDRQIADKADLVVEVVSGVPDILKGDPNACY